MRESLGTRLRRQREDQQISIDTIAASTKVSGALFHGLERDDVTGWPSGIYRRAFIRSYAEAIGLDPDAVCREFLEQFPDPGAPGVETGPAGRSALSTPMTAHLGEWQRMLAGPEDPLDTLTELVDEARLPSGQSARWRAAACDVTGVLVIGCLAVALFGQFWMPVAIAACLYYVAGTILLGKTPSLWWIERRAAHEHMSSAPGLGHRASLP